MKKPPRVAVRRISDLLEMQRIKAQANVKKSEPLVTKLYQLERKYKGAMWNKFTSLVHDETMANVFADRALDTQSHLGKDALKGMWGKAQHANLRCAVPGAARRSQGGPRRGEKFFTDSRTPCRWGSSRTVSSRYWGSKMTRLLDAYTRVVLLTLMLLPLVRAASKLLPRPRKPRS
jgi:hypothetical protein